MTEQSPDNDALVRLVTGGEHQTAADLTAACEDEIARVIPPAQTGDAS